MARLMNSMMKVVVVDPFVYLSNAGVNPIASRKPTKLATILINPQLMESPTPYGAVYITANSYATNKMGKRKNPRTAHATKIRVLSTWVSAM